MKNLPKRKANHLSAQKKKLRTPYFSLGDPAVLIYTKKDRTAKILVTITQVLYSMSLGTESSASPVHRVVGYRVRSETGGELTTSPDSLRPGNALDHIVTALEND